MGCRGLDDLKERTTDFYKSGARFAKWRTTVRVRDHSALAVSEAAHGLARYASICQSAGLVPIVEPEILMDGSHGIEVCALATQRVWEVVIKALHDHRVMFEGILLKPNMVLPGADNKDPVTPADVAKYTIQAL